MIKGEGGRRKEKRKKKGKFPIKGNGGKQKIKKIPDQRSEENRRNMKKGLWTRQYLNNTELSQVNKKRKKTTTWNGPLPLIANQNPVR